MVMDMHPTPFEPAVLPPSNAREEGTGRRAGVAGLRGDVIRALGKAAADLRSQPLVAFMVALAVWISCTPTLILPRAGLDDSWGVGVNWAILTGKQFGVDVDFTYGPLANLDWSAGLSSGLLVASVIGSVATGLALCTLLWLALRRWLPHLPAALALLFVVAPLVSATNGFSSRVLLISIVCAIGVVVDRPLKTRTYLAMAVVLSSLAALATLAKISNGVLSAATVVLIVTLAPLALRFRGAILGLAALSYVSAGAVAWVLAGQSLANLLSWVAAAAELTSGYPEAMGLEAPGGELDYLWLLVAVLALAVQVTFHARERLLPLLVVVAWVVLLAVKLGFTRHDPSHTGQAFGLLLVTGLTIGAMRWRRWLPAVGSLAVAFALATTTLPAYAQIMNPLALATRSVDVAKALLSSSYRETLLSATRVELKNYYDLDPNILAALEDRRVHVDPWEISAAWAYQLDWTPVPIFQSYSAYTRELDAVNAEVLASDDGPEAVLRAELVSIDYRNPVWESPLYMQSLMCLFEPVEIASGWMVLSRSGDRCSSQPVDLGTVAFEAGETIKLPEPPDDRYMVLASFRLDDSPTNQLAGRLFRPFTNAWVETDEGSYRLIRSQQAGPLIMSLPQAAGWPAEFGGTPGFADFSLNTSGSVHFTSVAID